MPNQKKDNLNQPPPKTPTKATVPYKVQKNDTFASIGNPQQIMALNPGVPALSTGQVINIPATNSAFPVTNNPYLNQQPNVHTQAHIFGRPAVPTAQGSFVAGNGNVNMTGPRPGFQTPATNGFMAPQLTGGTFYSGSGEVNLTGVVAGSNNGTSGYSSSGGAAPRPTGVYTGGNDANSIAWRRYWNQQAGGRGNEVSYLPNRNTVWEQNADRRRRNGGIENYSPQNNYVPPDYTPIGNAVNTALSWRVG